MKKTSARYILALLPLIGMMTVFQQANARRPADDVREIVKKVKSTYASTKTAKIRFEQSGGSGKATGTLMYAPGNKYRIELPKQTIVSDGARVWTYVPAKNQVVVSRASNAPGRLTPEDILTAFPGDYSTVLVGTQTVNGRSVWVVRCTPGSGRKIGDVTKATLYVDKATYRFQQVDIESPSMGSMTLRILSPEYDKSIPDSQFSFAAPKGARVVDLAK